MKNKFIIAVLLVSFLTSCGTSKKSVSKRGKSQSKEQILLVKSDKIFNAFEQNEGSHLNKHTLAYIDRYKHIAIRDMLEYKILASITLAQGVLESGSGRSQLASMSNNHFGIKCHKNWNGEKVYYDDDEKGECFRKYFDPEESFDDHSTFLTSRSRYAGLFALKPGDYKAWAKGLRKAGYATDKKYPNKLIKIIEDYHLYDYDALVLDKKVNRSAAKKTTKKPIKNDRKYILVKKGDTLYSIARKSNLSVSELKKRNRLISDEISIGQKLYLSK